MTRTTKWTLAAALALGASGTGAVGQDASPATQPSSPNDSAADAIIAQITAIKPPQPDRSRTHDEAYITQWRADYKTAYTKRAELIQQLYATAPDDARTFKLLNERWQVMTNLLDQPDKAKAEVEKFIADHPDSPHKVDALFARAQIAMNDENADAIPPINDFIKAAPKDPRGGQLLLGAAGNVKDPAQRVAALNRVISDYSDPQLVDRAKSKLKAAEGIGKPFELAFTDAINGKPMSAKDLKGKVVVVDFWATWCGPCVAEMPHNKEIYAQYKDKGVEFIGVSLDQPEDKGGLTALREFVKKNDIQWPQYYQGNYWESDFSKSWGIDSIPCVFILDKQGNLYSTEARGKLEKLIPELLAKS